MIPSDAYNPSIIHYEGRRFLSCRAHDRKDWRTSIYLAELDEAFKPTSCAKVDMPLAIADNSHEDGRLFQHQGKLWLCWTCSQWPATQFRCVVCLGQIESTETGWKIERYFIPEHGQNNWMGMEKNWPPFVCRDQLWCYYMTHEGVQTFIRLEGDKVVETVQSQSLEWKWGPIHGGVIARADGGTLWHVFNSRTGATDRFSHRYHVGVAELAAAPPFTMLRISQRPVLYGVEGYNLNGNRFFKPNVVFACGAMWQNQQLLVAHGWNDSKCRIARLNMEDLKL